jgi:hypothetical protein
VGKQIFQGGLQLCEGVDDSRMHVCPFLADTILFQKRQLKSSDGESELGFNDGEAGSALLGSFLRLAGHAS